MLLCAQAQQLNAQSYYDSLEAGLEGHLKDTNLFHDYLELSDYYMASDSARSFFYIKNAQSLAKELGSKSKQAEACYKEGRFYLKWGFDLEHTAKSYKNALELFRNEKDVEQEIEMTLRLANVYKALDDQESTFNVYQEALTKHEGENYFAAVINNAIGSFMKDIGEYEKALEYMNESDHFCQLIDSSFHRLNMVRLSNDKNRGVIYRNNESFDTAEFYFNRSLQLSIELEDSAWIARNYNSIGIMYHQQSLFLQAIDMYKKSLEIKRALNYTDGIVTSLTNLGGVYIQIGDYRNAKACFFEADEMCQNGCEPRRILNLLEGIADYYYHTGNGKLAYEKLKEANEMQDSILEAQHAESTREIEAKFQTSLHKIESEKLEAELLAADLREQNKSEQIQTQRLFIFIGIGFTLLLIVLVAFVIRSNVRRAAVNKELQMMNEEILEKSQKIETQKQQIEIKNQEIVDSINYAKRIQSAIMPTPRIVKEHLTESFVLYKPKDIVAGDFYWMEKLDNEVLIAAADCTGHGVPGAMVSVVCNNGLNRAVREYNLTKPGEILDKTRELVIQEFGKSDEDVKDGMDIALCSLNGTRLKYAGAHNPLWIIRKESDELEEIKANKQPIGQFDNPEPYTTHEIELNEGDSFYIFSDGLADQFGGDKGKKFKATNFKKLLLSIQGENMQRQLAIIDETFEQWKGTFEQLDDICVIGVRV